MKVFLKHFIAVLCGSFILYFLIESLINKEVKIFDIFLNFQDLLRFIFFISSSWTIISLYKTGEFIAIQTSRVSPFRMSIIFTWFVILFSVFYLVVYNGLILKLISTKASFNNSALNEFLIYNKIDDCNYELMIIEKLIFNEKKDIFNFSGGDFLSFQNCKLNFHQTLKKGTIRRIGDGIEFAQNNIQTEYKYHFFVEVFKEQVKNKSFKTFYEKIKLAINFYKNNIPYNKILLEILLIMENVLSFFCMTLFPFLFFSKLPPRSSIILKFFTSLCFVASIHMISLIFNSWILKTDFVNPILVLIAPSLFLCFIYLGMVLQKL